MACVVVSCADSIDNIYSGAAQHTAVHSDDAEFAGLSLQEVSLQLFERHVMPELVMCAGCHASKQTPYFASPEVEKAHQAIIDGNKVDFNNVRNSRLVQRLLDDEHNCGDDCQANGEKLLAAVTIWQEGRARAADQSETNMELRTIGHSIKKREVYYDIGHLLGEEYGGGHIMMIATVLPLFDVKGGVSLSNLRIIAHQHVIYLKGVKPLIDDEWQSINAVFAPQGCGLVPPGGGVPRGKDTTIAFTPEEGEDSELSFEFAQLRVVEDGETLTLCNGKKIIVGKKKKTNTDPPSPPSPQTAPPPVATPQQQMAYDNNINNVRTTLTSRCASCHGYMGNFNGIWNKRTAIKDRISRATGAAGVMPPSSPPLTQAQIDAIVMWLDM